jgi:hypothetical protein
MMKRLILLIVLVFLVSTVQAVTIITTAEDLQAVGDDLDGDYILGNDIDLTGFPWEPISYRNDGENISFTGTFDGADHIINGLTSIDSNGASDGKYKCAPLIGVLGASGVVKNVGLTNVNVLSDWYVSALVGDCYGTVSRCYVKGGSVTIVGTEGRGGNCGTVIGMTRAGATVTDCYGSDVTITFASNLDTWNSQGGFIGGQHCGPDGLTANCYFEGTIIGFAIGKDWREGGGFLDHSREGSVTTSCYYDMDVAGFDDTLGFGRTTIQMKTQANFVGWDFDDTWTMIEGQTYPTLIPDPPITIYVDDDAPPDGDGLSWATAFKYLWDGLAVASYGDEVRVAQGTYKPDRNSRNPAGTGSRAATFQLPSGVAVYGGYAGLGEPNPDDRDIEAYQTILSGDLAGNDGPDFANNGENSYHVANCSNTDTNTILNGLTITAGNAGSSSSIDDGGGVLIQAGNPVFNNCTFIGNIAQDNGGGMATYSGYPRPKMNNCMFIGNSAGNDGGGLGCGHSEPTLINCTFTGNSAAGDGGGICSFAFGAILSVKNCILWDNTANEGPEIALKSFEGSTIVNYSCLQGGELDIYTNSSDLVWGEGNIGEDFVNDEPLFVDADNGDYHLKSEAGRWDPVSESWITDGVTSPCIDAGNPGCDLGDEPVDVNNVRINMGAYGGTNKASKTPANWASLADLTNDHKVNLNDWGAFAAYWMDGGHCIPSDLDRNEVVNLLDINLFTNEWLWEK